MNNNQKITVPEIRWPNFTPPPEREGMRWTGKIEIRVPQKDDAWFNGYCWKIAPAKLLTPVPVAIYEPAPILCPGCGAEMDLRSNICGDKFWMICSENRCWESKAYKSKEEALAAAECLRGLWEKKQKEKVE